MKQINRHQIGGLFLVLLATCQPWSASAMGTFDFQQAVDNHDARWEAVAPPVETSGGFFTEGTMG
jgi:hypothetical protein